VKISKINTIDFLEFEPNSVYNTRLEHFFFVQNFAIIGTKRNDKITFKYTSPSWSNMVFMLERGRDVQYIKMDLKELLPILSKNDCLINLPLGEICQIYGKTAPEGDLCDDTHDEWQNHLEMNILVYRSTDGRINKLKGQISAGAQDYEETISLIANQQAYEVYTLMRIYTYIYVHIRTYTYICVYIRIYIYIYIYIYTYIYVHIRTYTYICVYIYIYVHIRTNAYIYIHIRTYAYIYIHIRTYTYIYVHIRTCTYNI